MKVRLFILLAIFAAGDGLTDAGEKTGTDREAGATATEARRQLAKEIAALEARMRAALPECEREQHAWEAQVLQRTDGAKEDQVPARIVTILALEPSEREPAQREELAAYFHPRSKTLGPLVRQLAAKRAALARLSR